MEPTLSLMEITTTERLVLKLIDRVCAGRTIEVRSVASLTNEG
jgi:hypothetical protein